MPFLSILFIRSSLIYLVAGFSLGTLLLWQKATLVTPGIWKFLPLHLEVLTFGWIIQLVFGVAYWILPRFGTAPLRGNETVVWISYIALNLGIAMVGFQNFLPAPEVWALCGRGLELIAVLSFGKNSWSRIKPFGDQTR